MKALAVLVLLEVYTQPCANRHMHIHTFWIFGTPYNNVVMLQDKTDHEPVEIIGDIQDHYRHVDNPQSKVAEH